jgi:hypothetical protein
MREIRLSGSRRNEYWKGAEWQRKHGRKNERWLHLELANRTGLWMFCGVRREDDVSGPVSGRRERVRLYSRPGNDLAKRLDQR